MRTKTLTLQQYMHEKRARIWALHRGRIDAYKLTSNGKRHSYVLRLDSFLELLLTLDCCESHLTTRIATSEGVDRSDLHEGRRLTVPSEDSSIGLSNEDGNHDS